MPLAGRKLAGSGEGFRRFRRANAPRGDERVAVGDVQLRQLLPLRGLRLDFVGLRHRRQQRLSLGDLRHLRRPRKAFEGRREDGVGVGGTAGRLVELGEGEGRAQAEAARALLLRDGDGG